MELKIYLIRHGQSTGNAIGYDTIGQKPDTVLTDFGMDQAKKLGKRLKALKKSDKDKVFDFVYSSDYARALSTAKIACSHLDIKQTEIVHVPELREYNAGDWMGESRVDKYKDLKLVERMLQNNMGFPFPNGETLFQVQRRATTWLEDTLLYNKDMLALDKSVKVAIFSHGQTIKSILQYIMGFDRAFLWKMSLKNTSISLVHYSDQMGWSLKTINDHAHLL